MPGRSSPLLRRFGLTNQAVSAMDQSVRAFIAALAVALTVHCPQVALAADLNIQKKHSAGGRNKSIIYYGGGGGGYRSLYRYNGSRALHYKTPRPDDTLIDTKPFNPCRGGPC